MLSPSGQRTTFVNHCDVDVHELERFHRSLAMLTPGQLALRREEALALLAERAELQERLELLRSELRRLAEM